MNDKDYKDMTINKYGRALEHINCTLRERHADRHTDRQIDEYGADISTIDSCTSQVDTLSSYSDSRRA